jgi:adenylosuccinate lyase
LLRGYAVTALENVALWHERDISHSSAERVIAPDACLAADFMLRRFQKIVDGMVIKQDRMLQNLESSKGVIFSGGLLIALADAGLTREEAYQLVQKHALAAGAGGGSLEELVKKDPQVTKLLTAQKLKEVFDLSHHQRQIDFIFERALR